MTGSKQVETAPKNLVVWSDVLKEFHPGSIGFMSSKQKKRLERAVQEFLETRLGMDEVQHCVLSVKGKSQPALPKSLHEPFMFWLDERIEKGLLDKDRIEAWIKAGESESLTAVEAEVPFRARFNF
jgi:hypothetical protein